MLSSPLRRGLQAEQTHNKRRTLTIPNTDETPVRQQLLEKPTQDHVHTVQEDLRGNPGEQRSKRKPQLDNNEHHSVAQDTGITSPHEGNKQPSKRVKVSLD